MDSQPRLVPRSFRALVRRPAAGTAPDELRRLFDRAVETAFFILGDRGRALEVAIEAVAKLRVAVRVQERRRTYVPKGRRTSDLAARATRTRASADDAHLLQRLVFVETERWEREQEQAGRVGSRDLLLRYVKHLVRLGLKRNSFYVTLGLSRLLYRYSTIETMEIYSLVIQDPDRVRDDHYYRSRKKQLLEEVLARFDGLLALETGPRGEHRFRTRDADATALVFVTECLRHFTPWESDCPVPVRFDPWSDPIPTLLFQGSDPDDEHPIETNRFHATIHPECYGRLTAALALPPPAERLGLPEFSMSNDASSRDGRGGTPLAETEEFRRAQERWSDDARRRAESGSRSLSIVVDGAVRGHLDRGGHAPMRLRVPATTESVEIQGSAGETLAVWLAGFQTPALRSSAAYAVSLENGDEIVIRRDRPDDLLEFDIEVSCHPAPAPAGARFLLPRLWAQLVGLVSGPRAHPAWATLGLVALLFAVAFVRPRMFGLGSPAGAPIASPDSNLTRGEGAAATLATVRHVFVDPLGATDDLAALRESLRDRLEASGRFERASRRSQADAVITARRDPQGAIALALVNARGETLWQGRRAMPEGQSPADAAAALADELVAAARLAATASRP